MSGITDYLAVLMTQHSTVGPPSGLTGTELNPSDAAASSGSISFSGSNLTAQLTAGQYGMCRATSHLSTGKWYFECEMVSRGGTSAPAVAVGVATATAPIAHTLGELGFAGSDALSIGAYNSDGAYVDNSSLCQWVATPCADGDHIAIAVDLGASKIWFNNLTQGSGWNWGNAGANPATGAGGITIAGMSGLDVYPAIGFYFSSSTNPEITVNFGDSPLSGVVPVGYNTWDS